MKHFISFILLALLPVVASAYDALIDGVVYDLSGDEATVTFWEYNMDDGSGFTSYYTGDIVVPASVTFNGKTYNVTGISSYAFANSKNLTSVAIPESVTRIGEGAFMECGQLASISIPGNVKSISDNAFMGCGNLASVSMGDSVTSIGYASFYNCSSLTSIVIPESVTDMGESAFEGCKALTSVGIPSSMKAISKHAFNGCTSLTSLTIGEGVASIGQAAFGGCSSLASVTIPHSVTSVGEAAFIECNSLASVIVSESITSIGQQAFDGTAWYNKQPSGLIYLGRVAYRYKGTLPEGTQIEIKEGTIQIASEAFRNCEGLTSVTIPEGLTTIDSYAFCNCKNLAFVNIPESVTSIGGGAFGTCRALTSINLPASITNISNSAFGLSGLTSVTIPGSVTTIGDDAFSGCKDLTSVTIPESVTSIGGWAFLECTALTSITIPNSVTNIGRSAFYGCSGLTSVTISSSVKSIGLAAFEACRSLTEVFCLAENVPGTGRDVFKNSPISLATLHVPAGSVEQYQKTSPWSGFGTITALPTEVVTFIKNQMATIILPIAPDASKGRYYRLDRCEKGQIVFEQELQPHARTPYIIVPSEDFSIDPSTLDLEGLTQDAVSIEGISFIGSYIGKVLPSLGGDGGDSYYDIIDKTPDCGLSSLGETGKGAFIGVLRAYLQVPWDEPYNPGGTKGPEEKMEIVLKDNPNGINDIKNEELRMKNWEGAIYDLSGRRQSAPQKGMNIIRYDDGTCEKVLVK